MPEFSRASLLRAGLTFCAAYVVLSAAFVVYGAEISSAFAPLLRPGIDLVQSNFEVRTVEAEPKKLAVAALMSADGIVGHLVGGKVMTMRVPSAALAIAPVLVFSLCIAFPQRSRKAKAATLLFAMGAVLAIMSVQIVNVLNSALTAKLLRKPPAFHTFMLENGGLQVLSVLSAGLSVWFGTWLIARLAKAQSAPPAQVEAVAETPVVPKEKARGKRLKPARGRAR